MTATGGDGGHRIALDLLDTFAEERLDPLLSKSGVVDRLLDLRNAAAGDRVLVAAVDQRIHSVPGRTTTEAGWWRHEVIVLQELFEAGCRESELTR